MESPCKSKVHTLVSPHWSLHKFNAENKPTRVFISSISAAWCFSYSGPYIRSANRVVVHTPDFAVYLTDIKTAEGLYTSESEHGRAFLQTPIVPCQFNLLLPNPDERRRTCHMQNSTQALLPHRLSSQSLSIIHIYSTSSFTATL